MLKKPGEWKGNMFNNRQLRKTLNTKYKLHRKNVKICILMKNKDFEKRMRNINIKPKC